MEHNEESFREIWNNGKSLGNMEHTSHKPKFPVKFNKATQLFGPYSTRKSFSCPFLPHIILHTTKIIIDCVHHCIGQITRALQHCLTYVTSQTNPVYVVYTFNFCHL